MQLTAEAPMLYDPDAPQFEKRRKRDISAMPAGGTAARTAARKETYRSARRARVIGRATGGIRQRRGRKYD